MRNARVSRRMREGWQLCQRLNTVSLEISYSFPTFIAMRSGKHDSSTVYTHGYDFQACVEMEEFNTSLKVNDNLKPIAFLFVHGGPDENPRYPKMMYVYIQHFKQFDFDVLMVSTHAPGMSAYNYFQRRVALLSKELTGVVLPHITFWHTFGPGEDNR